MKIKLITLLLFTTNLWAKPNVYVTLPEIGWAVKEIAEDKVDINYLLSGHEDPHFVDVTPAFIFKLKKADLLIKNGLALESTWLPKVIELAANPKLKTGVCDASSKIKAIGKRDQVDRSMGDVHPQGNPHFFYSPKQFILAAEAIKDCLVSIDKNNKEFFSKNYQELEKRLKSFYNKTLKALSNKKMLKLMTYHAEFNYFCRDYNLSCIGTVEKTPGVLPSAGHMVNRSKFIKTHKVSAILATKLNSKSILDKIVELSQASLILTSGHMNKSDNYTDFVNKIIKQIEKL